MTTTTTTMQDPATSVLVREPRPGAVWLTVDRAHKHNALARPVLAELAAAVRAAGAREATRYVVVTGAGDKYFAAGGDLRDLSNVRDEAAVIAMMEEAGAALDAIRHCPVPVIALLNGDAIGGGAELALACDMRLQGAHARIGYIQARLAITSAWGGGPDLFQLIGPAHAMRMMSRCELVGAEQALAWGLADAVVRDGADGEDVAAFLKPLDACAPQVLRGIKAQAIAARQGAGWKAHRAIEQQHLVRTWLHDDHWAASDKLLSKGS
jgi:enoyl-CoA hydratase